MILEVIYLCSNFVRLLRKLSLSGLDLGFAGIVVHELTLNILLLLFGFLKHHYQLGYHRWMHRHYYPFGCFQACNVSRHVFLSHIFELPQPALSLILCMMCLPFRILHRDSVNRKKGRRKAATYLEGISLGFQRHETGLQRLDLILQLDNRELVDLQLLFVMSAKKSGGDLSTIRQLSRTFAEQPNHDRLAADWCYHCDLSREAQWILLPPWG